MNIKGQSLSLNTIIIAVLAVIVLVVLIVIFTTRIHKLSEADGCETVLKGECKYECAGFEVEIDGTCSSETQKCCRTLSIESSEEETGASNT